MTVQKPSHTDSADGPDRPSRTAEDPAAPLALAIELSGRAGAVGLGSHLDELHLESVHKTSRHDDDLMPAIDRLCARAAVFPSQIREVRISIGPGGFTGLRISITTAKMLGLAFPRLRIIPVPAAWVLAQAAVEDVEGSPLATQSGERQSDRLLVMMAGKQGKWWAQSFAAADEASASLHDGGHHVVVTPGPPLPASGAMVRWPDAKAPVILCDVAGHIDLRLFRWIIAEPVDELLIGMLNNTLSGAPAGSAQVYLGTPSVRACWLAGRTMSRQGMIVSPEELLPLYTREPEARRLWVQQTRKGK